MLISINTATLCKRNIVWNLKSLLDLEKQLDDLVKSSKDSTWILPMRSKLLKKDRANEEGGICRSFPLAKGATSGTLIDPMLWIT